jgi:hypothetical protein
MVFAIKAFTDLNFCRSERHVERLAKIEMEKMGTEKLSISVEEIEAEKLEPSAISDLSVHKLSDRTPTTHNE